MKNLIGQRFGRLTPIKRIGIDNNRNATWLCQCDCGNEKIINGSNLRRGNTKSCGCLCGNSRNNLRHGHNMVGKTSKTYTTWQSMIQRCSNKNHKHYKNYGGRGIIVCDRWNPQKGGLFINFLEDMGEIPKHKEIDRINNNLGYCKENCKISTRKEQHRNKRNNKLITYNGKTQCLAWWAEKYKIPYQTLYRRICTDKWIIEKTLTTSVRKCNR